MARRKQTDAEAQETVQPETLNTETAGAEIPDNVTALLKAFPEYPELWISSTGGVYASKPAERQRAILYKNPFYNS